MAEIIKLENIQPKIKGGVEELIEEYICSNCRHLVSPTDITCWQCGGGLSPSVIVEHYHKGEKLGERQFRAIVSSLPEN